MDLSNLILLIVIAAAAYYMGYQQGRASLMMPRAEPGEPEEQPSPGPRGDHLPGPSATPSRPRAAPPPAAAGGQDDRGASNAGSPPRRTTKPPPAAAGLMDKGRAASDSSEKGND
jgi:hypothetical protein